MAGVKLVTCQSKQETKDGKKNKFKEMMKTTGKHEQEFKNHPESVISMAFFGQVFLNSILQKLMEYLWFLFAFLFLFPIYSIICELANP